MGQAVPYTGPLLLIALLCGLLSALIWPRRAAPGALPLVGLLLGIVIWTGGYALEWASPALAAKGAWAQFQYLGITALPACWLVFTIQYTGHQRWLTPAFWVVLLIEPLLTLVLVASNPLHGWIWPTMTVVPVQGFTILRLTHGVAFWAHSLYSYLLLAGSAGLLLWAFHQGSALYRRQSTAVLISSLLPWCGNLLYVTGISPFPDLDLTPIAFAAAALILAFTLLPLRLLDLVPVARTTVLENIPDRVLILDAQDRVLDLNPAAARALGVAAQAALGRPARQVLTAWPDLVARYGAVYAGQAEMTVGVGAAARTFDLQITPLPPHRGQATGRIVLWRDITAAHHAAGVLEQQNAYLAALHETTLDLVCQLDITELLEALIGRAGILVDTDHGFLYVVDEARQELVAQVSTGLFAHQAGMRLQRGQGLAGQVWTSGQGLIVDDYATWEDQSAGWGCHATIALPLRQGTAVLGVIGLAYQEVTRTFGPAEMTILTRFADLAAVALHNAQLYDQSQRALFERTQLSAALQQELVARQRTAAELYQAKEAAEAATLAKSAFLANMSHELRTPLTVILGFSDLLSEELAGRGETESQQMLGRITNASQHLLTLIDAILDLAKIEAGRMEVEWEVLSLAAVIQEVAVMVQPLMAKNGNKLTVDAPSSLGTFYSDETKLRQILLNLLSNAAKFTTAGMVHLAATHAPTPMGDGIVLTVTDSGIGITAEQVESLFAPFTQADTSTTRKYGGTGLGLALTRRLCQLLGGDITAARAPQQGSIFTVYLPTYSRARCSPPG